MGKMNGKILLLSLVAIAFVGGVAMAAPKGNANHGYDEYGYNERAETFNGCYTNYVNWKSGEPAVECSETDIFVHAKWKFDKEDGSLMWLLNVLYNYPNYGETTENKFVTIGPEACAEAGGEYWGELTVTQTGDLVPICQIFSQVEGQEPTIVATPAGFGFYKNE